MSAPLLELVAQSAALTGPIDPVKVIIGSALALGALLVGLVKWFLGRMVGGIDGFKKEMRSTLGTMRTAIDDNARETQAIRQELVGLDGRNGLKGEVRELKHDLRRVSRTVDAIVARDGLEIDLPEEEVR